MAHDRRTFCSTALALPLPLLLANAGARAVIDVRDHGARGDGRSLDSDAINRAIAAAAKQGGGTVFFPTGDYLSFTIRLASRVTLEIGAGATIIAADPKSDGGAYDLPEATEHDVYQDFGHSHFRNSLIWGEDLEDVAIRGTGRIFGKGLTRHGPGAKWTKAGSHPVSMQGMTNRDMGKLEPDRSRMNGLANKAIALKNCRGVTLEGFSILKGGHFAVLATGIDDLAIENLRIDTDRDGIDIDACRDVRVAGCKVNSPNDDAIVLKASLALGFARACENVTISDCIVSGYDMGTMLDGTLARTQELAPDRDRVTGRIKLGTESNGGFRNIAIRNCVFYRSRGLALETVDGGVLEDVTIANLTMRDVTTAPIFLRVGDRRRGPDGTGVGAIRRVTISNITATGIDPRYAASIVGLSDSRIEDVSISNVRLVYAGGGTAEEAVRDVPEMRGDYPEPSMFGVLPAHGLYIRHARNVRIDGLEIATALPDVRPAVIVDQAEDIRFSRLDAAAPFITNSKNIIVGESK